MMLRLSLVAGAALAIAVLAGSVADAAARAPLDLLVVAQEAPAHADAVAVHGGGGPGAERERAAATLWREGRADRVLAMGGPLPDGDPDGTYARAVERRLRQVGVPTEAVRVLPLGSSTAEELHALRQVAEVEGWASVVVATSRWHSRRVSLIAGQVFADSEIRWSVIVPEQMDLAVDRWWDSRRTRNLVVGEWLKVGLALAFPAGAG